MENKTQNLEKSIEPMPSELEEKIEMEENGRRVLYIGQIRGIHNHGADIMGSYALTKKFIEAKTKTGEGLKKRIKKVFAKAFSDDAPELSPASEWSYLSDLEDHSLILHGSPVHPPILYNSPDDIYSGLSGRGGLYQNAAQEGTLIGPDLIEKVFGRMETRILEIYKQRIELNEK